ncbi:MAG: hypothetical protein WD626_06925 [Bauldia sp.]
MGRPLTQCGALGTERTDYLTFAQGAVPLSVGGEGASMGATFEHAVESIDGNPGGFVVVTKGKGTDATATEFVYELPALTTFDRFAVPEVHETPSPSQTFTRVVEIYGSAIARMPGTNSWPPPPLPRTRARARSPNSHWPARRR